MLFLILTFRSISDNGRTNFYGQTANSYVSSFLQVCPCFVIETFLEVPTTGQMPSSSGEPHELKHSFQNEAGSEEDDDIMSPSSIELPMPNSLPWRSHAFPFASNVAGNIEDVRAMLLNSLPDGNTIRRQLDIYWRHAAWM